MTLYLLRAIFVLTMAGIGYTAMVRVNGGPFGASTPASLWLAVIVALLVLAVDGFSSRRKLLGLSAVLFGTLVGMGIAYALSLVSNWLVDQFVPTGGETNRELQGYLRLMLNVVCCYIVISFIMQTKDDIRFIIPYVAFAKQVKGARPLILDTSVLIDGRIKEMAELGLAENRIVIPRFVLDELQALSDSTDKLRRNRGRRGLEIVAKLQSNKRIDVVIYEATTEAEPNAPVDHQLLNLAGEMDGRLLTTDSNLTKVAQVRGVDALNVNDIATALKPVVIPGDLLTIQLIKPGEQPGQAVGYLDDGTMVVVEQARQHIKEGDVKTVVTGIVQTSAGRMIFAHLSSPEGEPRPAPGERPIPRTADLRKSTPS